MQSQPLANMLKQHHPLFGTREFVLKGDVLLVREQSFSQHHETLIPLNLLEPNPTFSSSFAVKWLFHSLFMGTMSGLLFYWAYAKALPILYVLGVILTGTTLVLLYRFFLYTTRLVIFRHSHTHESYLYLWHHRPQRAQVEAFVKLLNAAIKDQAHKPRTTPPS